MHPARRLVTIIVGLVFLALHTCLASPASPLPLTARNIESLPTSPPPKSVWHTHDATLYGSSPDDVSLEKRAYRIYEFTAFPNENEDSWEIELDNRVDKIGQHGSDAPKIGQKEIVGTIEKTKPIEVFAERSSRTVFAGTWQRSGTCEAIPAAIKLANDPSVYYGAQVVSRIYHPNVVRVYQWARMEGFGGRAIAAYELLGDTAKKVWLSGKLDKKKFFEEAMLGILAGVEKDIFHMDIKLDNFLRNTTDDSPYYLWKVNDWDIFEKGKPEDERSDLQGNAGTFAPGEEMDIPLATYQLTDLHVFYNSNAGKF